MDTPLQIDKVLDVSTVHIYPADCKLLDEADRCASGNYANPFIVYKHEEGYRVWTGFNSDREYLEENLAEAKTAGYSEELMALVRVAFDNECRYLIIDRDGQEYTQFPDLSEHWD